jgi:hypothetical protein
MKTGLEKLEETELGWEQLAPDDSFYGMTLTQFKAKVKRSRDARALIASLKQQLQTAKNDCKDVDKENLALEVNVAKAIAGSEKYGDDSDLYESTGRIRKSEKKSGLTRKKKGTNGNS